MPWGREPLQDCIGRPRLCRLPHASWLPCHVVDPSLVRLTDEIVAKSEVFLLVPPTHRDTARVRIVGDAISDLFERECARLSGQRASRV